MLTRSRRRCIDATEEAAQQANKPALANLSDDLLLDCCKLLPVTSLVSFGACSKNLRQVANHGSLWTQLSIPPESAAGLTDQSLAGLLQRVDAKNYMVSISLVGCSKIDGSGLWPLHDSTALQAIDLRRAELDQGDLRARPLATSAQLFLVQMLPRLESVLVTRKDVSMRDAQPFQFRRALSEAGFGITLPVSLHPYKAQAAACALCRELVPLREGAAAKATNKCRSCLHDFCWSCEDEFFRDCAGCGLWRCMDCLEFEGIADDGEIYSCGDCRQDAYYNEHGYGSDGGSGG